MNSRITLLKQSQVADGEGVCPCPLFEPLCPGGFDVIKGRGEGGTVSLSPVLLCLWCCLSSLPGTVRLPVLVGDVGEFPLGASALAG